MSTGRARHGISGGVLVQLLALVAILVTAGVQVQQRGADLALPTPGQVPVQAQVRVPSSASPPVELLVAPLGFGTRLVGLRKNPDDTLQVPSDFARAGWWSQGPAPGDPGAAIIVGHVDDTQGPAVFFDLDKLVVGDEVQVRRADGSVVAFRVRETARFPKRDFPTDEVYGSTGGAPELRLITCGGQFDRATRSYRDNTVVFLSMV